MPMPGCVARLLYGPARLVSVYVAETLAAAREMSSSSLALVSDMLVKVGRVYSLQSIRFTLTNSVFRSAEAAAVCPWLCWRS